MMGFNSETTNGVKPSGKIHHKNGPLQKETNGNASTNGLHDISPNGLLNKIQEMRKDVLEHVNDRISNVMSELRQEIETYPEKTEVSDKIDKYSDKKQSSEDGILPDKVFIQRNSLLTDLFQITHFQAVYNMFLMSLILLLFNTIAYDIIDTGTLSVGTVTIQMTFAKFSMCLYIWSFMLISTLCIYLFFNIWAYQRLDFSPKSLSRKIWDYAWLITLLSYQVLFIVFPTKAMIEEDLSIACSAIILMEQLRLIMKSHAFVRSVAVRFLSYKPHTDTPKPKSPNFSHYLYFLFAPTLIYRDNYPRTKETRWRLIMWNFAEVGLVIFYYAFIMERFVGPVFHDFGKQPLDWRWYVKSILGAMIPGILLFVSGFYCLLHAWMNAWAELLRFADRLFYKDWWNCASYRTYYRTWNVVVHDWLYTYVYKDMYEIVTPRNKLLSTTAVFFVSSVFHEYILAFVFRFFYPVMLIMFGGIGFVLVFIKRSTGNVFMWTSLCMGTGIIVSLYAMEYYARINCSPYEHEYLDLILPRSWLCYAT